MITLVLVGITALLSYLAWKNPEYYNKGVHYPYREFKYNERWRSITGGFLHANPTHLMVNMYMLYMFGSMVENFYVDMRGETGRLLYLGMYLSTIIIANLLTGISRKNDPSYRSVGASGATSGILFIYILEAPWAMFIFPPLPAIILAIGYLVYSSWAAKNKNDNTDHMAHYYGAIWGVVFTLVFFPNTLSEFWHKLINDF
ncbi:MAG: rhomboid family intramembrane serine protease, partial [Saprospiraceae bacterium]